MLTRNSFSYYEEIKNPMDFGTMKAQLDSGHYSTMEEFAADVNLIFSNCRAFNPPTTHPTICADAVERAFKKEWVKAMEKKLTFQEKRSLQSAMTKLRDDIKWVISFFPLTLNGIIYRFVFQFLRLPRTRRPRSPRYPHLLRNHPQERRPRPPYHPFQARLR